MTSKIRHEEGDGFLTIRNVWLEAKEVPLPRNPISLYENNINILLGLFLGKGTNTLLGLETKTIQPVGIVDNLSSKALQAENSSINEGVRVQRLTPDSGDSQRRRLFYREQFRS